MPKVLTTVVTAAALCAAISAPLAQPEATISQPLMFGKGQPASIEDLPPGRVRERLESLQPPARTRALEWLQRLEFPAADLEVLQIDDEGGVLFVDPMLPPPLPGGSQD